MFENAKADHVTRASCPDCTFDPSHVSRAEQTTAQYFALPWHETASEANCKFYDVVHIIREEMLYQHSHVALTIEAPDFFFFFFLVEVLG